MLINLLVDVNATHIAVVFDSGKKTFRNEIYDKYKANRPPVPQELIPQFPLIREVAKALNLCVLEKEGYEADDIIATIALQGKKEGYEVLIVSSDKDLAQLVDENIFIYDAMKQIKVGIEEVKEKWGIENPKQLLDVLSLMGDSADNVPGVPSIGPKTASELINQFGSVENLIENLDYIKQEKRRNAIKDNLDNLILSKKLITLFTDVDIIKTKDE
jgi:DNA polymerase-1